MIKNSAVYESLLIKYNIFNFKNQTECKGFEPLCRLRRRSISNRVQLTNSANTPYTRYVLHKMGFEPMYSDL